MAAQLYSIARAAKLQSQHCRKRQPTRRTVAPSHHRLGPASRFNRQPPSLKGRGQLQPPAAKRKAALASAVPASRYSRPVRVLVIGSGICGVTAALELHARGCEVTLVDPGPLPHPLAESTDISKIVRCDYGADGDYTLLGERALDCWRRWNAIWRTPQFHETGVTFLTRAPMQPGGFEHESFTLLARRGHHVERLDAGAIESRFPAYLPGD